MAHERKVMRSVDAEGGPLVLRRPDGSQGFEEYRRDPEDPCGWFALSHHGERRLATAGDAPAAAQPAVPWPPERLDRGA